MTVFAIIMTAVAAFLLGLNIKEVCKGKTVTQVTKKTQRVGLAPIKVEDYRNFLSYDGSEQA